MVQKIRIKCDKSESVSDLLEKIEEKGIYLDNYQMIFDGKPVDESQNLSELGIKNDSVIYLILK